MLVASAVQEGLLSSEDREVSFIEVAEWIAVDVIP